MKVTSAPALALALALRGSADAVGPRAGGSITDILSSVLAGMEALDAQVVAYGGGPPLALRDAAVGLSGALEDGAAAACALDPVAPEEALALGPLAEQVAGAGESVLKELGCARSAFEEAGICEYLYKYTVHLCSVTDKFFSKVGEKFPEELQAEAQKEILATHGLFEKAEAALAPDACVNKVEPPSYEGAPFPAKEPGEEEPGAPTSSSAWYTTGYGEPKPTGASGNETSPKLPPKPVHTGDAARLSGYAGTLGAAAAAAVAVAAAALVL